LALATQTIPKYAIEVKVNDVAKSILKIFLYPLLKLGAIERIPFLFLIMRNLFLTPRLKCFILFKLQNR
jgi:hypothetical protein